MFRTDTWRKLSESGWIVVVLCLSCDRTNSNPRTEEGRLGVVSLVPAVTELLVALDEGHRLVGRAVSDSHPRITHLPAVGDVLDPNAELISSLNPELVVVWDDATVRSRVAPLSRRKVDIIAVDVQTLADLQVVAESLSVRLGFRQRVDSAFSSIRRSLDASDPGLEPHRPAVAFVVWLDPPVVAGPGSYPDELIGLAGGVNMVADTRSPWPQTSIEAIVALDPDVVVTALAGTQNTGDVLRRSAWAVVPAVKAGRIFAVDADLFTTPSLDVVAAVTQLRDVFRLAYADRSGL